MNTHEPSRSTVNSATPDGGADDAAPATYRHTEGCSRDADGRRAALVTGAGKRLGREIALGLARHGWDVAVHYRSSHDDAQATVADIEALGGRAFAIRADLADEREVDALFDEANRRLPLRAIVNSASHFDHDVPATFDAARLFAHVGPNVAAPVRLAQRLHRALDASQHGAVVNLLDQKLSGLNPDFFSYTLTKQALLCATTMMAMAFAPRLRVVGVSPGLTLPSYLQDEQSFERAHRHTALLESSSTAPDIVAAVLFLLDAPAITGINLTVDGGQHLLGLRRDVSYLDLDHDR